MNQLTFRLVPKLENEEHEPRILQLVVGQNAGSKKNTLEITGNIISQH